MAPFFLCSRTVFHSAEYRRNTSAHYWYRWSSPYSEYIVLLEFSVYGVVRESRIDRLCIRGALVCNLPLCLVIVCN